MLRILNVNTSLDILGGGQSERTFQMSRHLAAAGHSVNVLVLDDGVSADRIRGAAPAKVVTLPVLNRRYFIPRPAFGLIRLLVEEADVVHLMGYWSILNVMVSDACRTSGKPFVMCPAGSWRIYGRSKRIKRMFSTLFGSRMIRRAARLIAITDDEGHLYEKYGFPREKIVVVPNAVDPSAYLDADDDAFRRAFNLQRPFLLYLGRLSPIKGPDLLLEAYLGSELPARWDLVFAGPDEGMLEALAGRAEDAKLAAAVHFVGNLAGIEKSRALHASEAVVIPSRHEAMSIVALEAGATGKAVLLTDQCGLRIVEQVGGGVIVPATSDGLRDGLHRLAAADRHAMGRRLRELVSQRYTWSSVAGQYERLYCELVDRMAA